MGARFQHVVAGNFRLSLRDEIIQRDDPEGNGEGGAKPVQFLQHTFEARPEDCA